MKDLYTQIEISAINDENRMTYLSDLKAAGVNVVLISGIDLFQQGEERVEIFSHIAREIAFFKKEGFRVAFWTTTLGYGTPRTPEFEARFHDSLHLTEFGGRTNSALCTTDVPFTEACCEVARDLILAGADMILWDDDLVQSVRPGFACVCPGHLKLLQEKTGHRYTPDEIRDSFTGKPNELRTAFMDVMGESMMNFCRALRNAADEVNPHIPMGLCASYTHYDLEGVELDDLVRILAGEGKPFLRISGAAYWPPVAPRYAGQDLGGVTEFCRMQIGWLRNSVQSGNLTLIDENDPYPRNHNTVPAALCELYDAVMCANCGVDRHKYMLCYGSDRHDTAYLEAHIANQKDYSALERMFENTHTYGVAVCHPMHAIREAVLPTPYCGNKALMAMFSHPMAGIYLSLAGIPTLYDEPDKDMPGIAFGMDVLGLTDEQMKRGVILDIPGAEFLAECGIDAGEIPNDGKFPCSVYTNAKGQRFAVLPFDGSKLSYARLQNGGDSYGDKVQESLAELITAFSGIAPDVHTEGSHGIYIISARSNEDRNKLSVLLCNMLNSPSDNIRLVLRTEAQITETLRCTAEVSGNVLTVKELDGYDFAAITLDLAE